MTTSLSDEQIIEKLMEASERMKAADFQASLNIFLDLVEPKTGGNVIKFKSSILGMMGECYLSLGNITEAISTSNESIKQSQANDDTEGVITSLITMFEAYRYDANLSEAITICNRLETLLTQLENANSAFNYKKQAMIMQKGEPLNRVVAVVDGKHYEIAELAESVNELKGKSVQFSFLRNRFTLPPSKHYTNIGLSHQSKGEYTKAVDNFLTAAKLDVFDPDATYNLGIAYLHMEKYQLAIEAFHTTSKLAPGWYDVNNLLWIAQSMIDAKFGLLVFQTMHLLEHGRLTPPQKIKACESMLTNGHKYPVFMLHLGMAYQQIPEKVKSAEAAFRGGLLIENELDVDIKTRLLFNLAVTVPSKEEKDSLLKQAIELNGNLLVAAMAAATLSLGS